MPRSPLHFIILYLKDDVIQKYLTIQGNSNRFNKKANIISQLSFNVQIMGYDKNIY